VPRNDIVPSLPSLKEQKALKQFKQEHHMLTGEWLEDDKAKKLFAIKGVAHITHQRAVAMRKLALRALETHRH
jgi:hypothetical protein